MTVKSFTQLVLIGLFCIPVTMKAQTTGGGVEYKPFHIEEVVQLNDTLNAAAIRKGRTQLGVALINNKKEIVFDTLFREAVIGMAKFGNGDELIIFYTDDLYKKVDAIYAAVINLKTLKIERDKAIYTLAGEKKAWVSSTVLKDNNGYFKYLLMRIKDGYSDKEAREVNLLSIPASSLDPLSHDIKGAAIGSKYVASGAGSNGDWFITSITGTSLVTELYDNTCKLKNKLQTTINIREKSGTEAATSWNDDATRINMNIRYTNDEKDASMCVYGFDFASKKVFTASPIVLDKAYRKQISEGQEDLKTSTLKEMEYLTPVKVFNVNNKVVVVNEIEYEFTYSSANGGSTRTRYYNQAAIINIYDAALKQSSTIILDKDLEAFLPWCRRPGFSLQGSKLFMFGAQLSGIGSFGEYVYIIDLEKGTKVKKDLSPILKYGDIMNAEASMQFKDSYVLVAESSVWLSFKLRSFLYNVYFKEVLNAPDSKR